MPYTKTELERARSRMQLIAKSKSIERWVADANEELAKLGIDRTVDAELIRWFIDGDVEEIDSTTLSDLGLGVQENKTLSPRFFTWPTVEEFLDHLTDTLWRQGATFKEVELISGEEGIASVHVNDKDEDMPITGAKTDTLPIIAIRSGLSRMHDGNLPLDSVLKQRDVLALIESLSHTLRKFSQPEAGETDGVEERPCGTIVYSTAKEEEIKQSSQYHVVSKAIDALVKYAKDYLRIAPEEITHARRGVEDGITAREELLVDAVPSSLIGDITSPDAETLMIRREGKGRAS